MMSSPFIVVRFSPDRSAWWTSQYGVQASKRFPPTCSFLALCVSSYDLGIGSKPPSSPKSMLFVVSPDKPTGVADGCYFLLQSKGEREEEIGVENLIVDPPLPLSMRRPLFLHTAPFLQAGFNKELVPVTDPYNIQYCLDERSFRQFCGAVKPAMVQRNRLLALKKRSRGGGEPVPDGWDSWSGTAPTEWLHESQEFKFQKLPFIDLAVPLRAPLIFDELKMFHLLAMEYSWKGVSFTISWVQQTREFLAKQSTFEIPAFEEAAAEVPQFTGAFLDTAKTLYSMPIPVDGEPVPAVDNNSDEFSWDDEPTPQFAYLPTKRPAVPLGDVRFLVFDLFGAIFDREQAIRNALQPLLEFKTCTATLNELFQLYITFESLRSRQHSASTIELIRGALYDTTGHIGLIIGDEILATAINQISCPPLYPDANSTINTLHSRGFRLLCTSPIDTVAFELMQSSLPPELEVVPTAHTPTALHSPCPALYPTLLQYCDSKLPGVRADQVLVVTTSRYRVLEPATAAGIPTAWLHCPECTESNVQWRAGMEPSVDIDSLDSLCERLGSVVDHRVL